MNSHAKFRGSAAVFPLSTKTGADIRPPPSAVRGLRSKTAILAKHLTSKKKRADFLMAQHLDLVPA